MGRRTTADTPLTVKQTKFAAAVASGTPKVTALKAEYVHDPARKDANRRHAIELSQRPNVAAEIRRLTWLSCPPADDVRGMREHSIRVLSDLSRSSASDEVRLKAALALFRIAETTRAAAAPAATTGEQDKLLASLRKLYVEVQGAADRAERDGDLGPELAPLVQYDDEPIDIQAIAEPAPAAEPEEPAPAAAETAAQAPESGDLPPRSEDTTEPAAAPDPAGQEPAAERDPAAPA